VLDQLSKMFRWHFWCFFIVFTLAHEGCLLFSLVGNAEVANTAVTSSKTSLTSSDLKTITSRRPSSSARKVINLPILALLDLSPLESNKGQRINGSSLLKTAQQAVRAVNRRQIIPGYFLHLLVNDSKVF